MLCNTQESATVVDASKYGGWWPCLWWLEGGWGEVVILGVPFQPKPFYEGTYLTKPNRRNSLSENPEFQLPAAEV